MFQFTYFWSSISAFFFHTVFYHTYSVLSPLALLAALQMQQLKTILLMSF